VVTDDGELHADAVVIAAGAWTGLVPGALPEPAILRPARGQMAMVHTRAPLVRHVVFGAQGYVVPRPDGLLLGSTVEFVGFDKQVTAGGLASILARGIALIPTVADAPLVETWVGFRPHTADGLPLLGPGALPGLFLASGHFRNGILLAPITAALLRDLVLERAPTVDITAFRADRKARKL
jgi:glycine oxidase